MAHEQLLSSWESSSHFYSHWQWYHS